MIPAGTTETAAPAGVGSSNYFLVASKWLIRLRLALGALATAGLASVLVAYGAPL